MGGCDWVNKIQNTRHESAVFVLPCLSVETCHAQFGCLYDIGCSQHSSVLGAGARLCTCNCNQHYTFVHVGAKFLMLAAINTTGLLVWGPDLKRQLQSCYNLFDVCTRL